MALYPAAIQKPIPPGINDPKIKPRVVILHVAVFIGKSLYDYFKDRSGGVESHFYIRLDGTVEQYRDTSIQADANTDANDFAISIETEGMEYGVWTPEQLASIKALILWCHKTHDIPLVRCPAWDGSGIGYHTLFPGRWDKRGASCPGPDRKLQFNQVLVPWMRDGATDPSKEFTVADADDAGVLWTSPLTKKGSISPPEENESPLVILTRIARNVEAIAALEKASVDKVAEAVAARVGNGASATEIAKALLVELATTKETTP